MKAVFLFCVVAMAIINVQARTVQWTNAGGTPMWDFARNWDCNCVPVETDDIVINPNTIAATVRIGANPASCNSIKIGGGRFLEELIIQGPLTIGSGGVQVGPNGRITLESSSTSPLFSKGPFTVDQGGSFIFSSGKLDGAGPYQIFAANFTGDAAKEIGAKTTILNSLTIRPDSNGASVLVSKNGVLNSAFTQVQGNLVVDSSDNGRVNLGAVSVTSSKAVIRIGAATAGDISISDGVQIFFQRSFTGKSVSLGVGASLTLIGGPSDVRNITQVVGSGSIIGQGGSLTVDTIQVSQVSLSGASLTARTGSIDVLSLQGGTISGLGAANSAISITKRANLQNGAISKITLAAQGVSQAGLINLNDATLSASSSFTVTDSSQITLFSSGPKAGGAYFKVLASALIDQSNAFKVVPGSNDPTIGVALDAQWIARADLGFFVPVNGQGSVNMSSGNVNLFSDFTVTQMVLSQGSTLSAQGGSVTIPVLSGSGVLSVSGDFTSASVSATQATFSNGKALVNTATFSGPLTLSGAQLYSSHLSAAALTFSDGTLSGVDAKSTADISGPLVMSGTSVKSFANIVVQAATLQLSCDGDMCQVHTSKAKLSVN